MAQRSETPQLLPGTLELLVLSVLMRESLHGYAIARMIRTTSGHTLTIEEGSLYPALKRLYSARRVSASWTVSAGGRRTKTYAITPDGRKYWREQHTIWLRFAAAVDEVISANT